jgi:hypothetical protein
MKYDMFYSWQLLGCSFVGKHVTNRHGGVEEGNFTTFISDLKLFATTTSLSLPEPCFDT